MRSTSCTPSSTSSRRWIELPVAADRAEHGPQRAGRPVHVESHFHELRDHLLHLIVGGALLHDNNHGRAPLSFLTWQPAEAGLRVGAGPHALENAGGQ